MTKQKYMDVPLRPEALEYCEKFKNDPQTRSSIQSYKVGKVIGKGGFARVNLALDRITRKLVAIKSMNIAQLKQQNFLKRVVEEITIL